MKSDKLILLERWKVLRWVGLINEIYLFSSCVFIWIMGWKFLFWIWLVVGGLGFLFNLGAIIFLENRLGFLRPKR